MKYQVHIPVYTTVAIEVEAESEHHALRLGRAAYERRAGYLPSWLGLEVDDHGVAAYPESVEGPPDPH